MHEMNFKDIVLMNSFLTRARGTEFEIELEDNYAKLIKYSALLELRLSAAYEGRALL